jgi:hypothetical protein
MLNLNFTESNILLREGISDTGTEYESVDISIELLIEDWLAMNKRIGELEEIIRNLEGA